MNWDMSSSLKPVDAPLTDKLVAALLTVAHAKSGPLSSTDDTLCKYREFLSKLSAEPSAIPESSTLERKGGRTLSDRRIGKPDRRAQLPDLRVVKVERRVNTRDRRSIARGRRAQD